MRRTLLAPLWAPLGALFMTSAFLGCATTSSDPNAPADGWSRYGDSIAAGDAPQASLGAIGSAMGQRAAFEGIIEEVCQTKGCWMTLRSTDQGAEGSAILVRFRDYGFFVPRNAMGRQATVVGIASVQEYSVEALQHLAHDAGKSPAEIAAITQPRTDITIMADAVWIQGPGLQDPYRPIGQERCEPVDGSAR